jgi:transcriptional regulator with XRE-family HTH domain
MARPYGENIKTRRVELGITRSELAAMIDRSYQHIYNLETEENTADPAVLSRIATALRLPLDQVMRPEEKRPRPSPTSHPRPPPPTPRGENGAASADDVRVLA